MQMGVIFQPDCLDDLFIFLCCRRTSEVFYFATCCAFSGREIASKSSLIISLRQWRNGAIVILQANLQI